MSQELEIWKDVPGYEGLYQVSNLGRVKSLARSYVCKRGGIRHLPNKILKTAITGHGYLGLVFRKDGKPTSKRVHQLIWLTFKGLVPKGLVIDHINNDKLDNKLCNLQLLTTRQNVSKYHDTLPSANKYIGVVWDVNSKKWKSQAQIKGRLAYFGLFDSEEEAHKARLKVLSNEDVYVYEKPTYTSEYEGVYWHKSVNKWATSIPINGKQKYLGSFSTELEAYEKRLQSLINLKQSGIIQDQESPEKQGEALSHP